MLKLKTRARQLALKILCFWGQIPLPFSTRRPTPEEKLKEPSRESSWGSGWDWAFLIAGIVLTIGLAAINVATISIPGAQPSWLSLTWSSVKEVLLCLLPWLMPFFGVAVAIGILVWRRK